MRDGAKYNLILQSADGNVAQAQVDWKNGAINGYQAGTGFVGYLQFKDAECSGYIRKVSETSDENNPVVMGDAYQFKSFIAEGEDVTINVFSPDSGMTGIVRLEYVS